MADKSFFISTAISYPNGAPHIGHAYEVIATDTIARFKRLDGYNVHFVTGTDDHGQKMYQTARLQNKTAIELADSLTPAFRVMGQELDCLPDDFIRTSEARHHASVQELWRLIESKGDIYKDSYAGWYSVRDEAFYTEAELTTNDAGEKRAPTGTPVEWVEEESYFFRLSAYQEPLLDLIERNPSFIQPEARRNEIIQFVKGGLRDLSISRTSFDWGIPVPNDPKHVIYVWLDALTNYITSIGFPDVNGQAWKTFWPADVHIIGKDITRFHSVYWPAFLLSAGLALPKAIFAHGFLTVRGEKMSKSVGNVLDPSSLVQRYGADAVRFFFMREVPFGKDGSFSDEAIVTRVNADLANDLGNLAQRSLSMIFKNLGGALTKPKAFSTEDDIILKAASEMLDQARAQIDKFEIHNYLETVFNVVSEANKYFAAQEPWSLKASNPERMAAILYVAAEVVRKASILLQPVCPTGAKVLLDTLLVDEHERQFENFSDMLNDRMLMAPQPAFPRLDLPTDID